MGLQPVLKQGAHFPRQAQDDVVGADGSGLCRGCHNLFHFLLGNERNHRCDADRDRYAGVGESADGFQASLRRRRTGFKFAGEFVIEGGQGDGDAEQVVAGHVGHEVEIPFDQGGLGDQARGVATLMQDVQALAGNVEFPLAGLVGVGVDAQGNGQWLVAGFGEFATEQLRGVGFGVQAAFKIPPG